MFITVTRQNMFIRIKKLMIIYTDTVSSFNFA